MENKERLMNGVECGFHVKYNEEIGESYDVFWYALTGKAEDIAEYERIQTEAGYEVRRNDKGQPIFFSTKYAGKFTKVKITVNGKVVLDDLDMRRLSALANSTKGVVQQQIAQQGVAMLLGNLFKSSAPTESSEQTPEHSEVDPDEAQLDPNA